MKKYDYLIVAAGIIGRTIAHELKKKDSKLMIATIEKEALVFYIQVFIAVAFAEHVVDEIYHNKGKKYVK